jgi:hypothetical protein
MKKALVAAAVAGAFAAAPAMAAELSTNIYWSQGIAVGDTTTTEATTTSNNGKVDAGGLNDGGGNRLMMTWSDTLDNGMGLTAYVGFGNLGFSNNDPSFANNTVSLRNSHIALSGDHGTVAFGSTETMSELDLIMDPMYGDYGDGADPLSFINIGQTGANFTRRDGESVWWNSNVVNGFQFKAFYTFGPQNQTATADPDGMQLGVVYNSGPLMIGLNQATYNDYASSMMEVAAGVGGAAVDPVAGNEGQMTSLRASYDFGMFNIGGAAWDLEQSFSAGNEHTDSLGAINNKYQANGRMFIVKVPMAAGTVWIQSSTLSDLDATVAATGVSASVRDSGKDGLDVGYVTPLNANVNAFVRYASSETGVNFDADDGATDTEEYMIGLQLSY